MKIKLESIFPYFLAVCFYWKVEKWRHASFGQKPQNIFILFLHERAK